MLTNVSRMEGGIEKEFDLLWVIAVNWENGNKTQIYTIF